MITVAEMMEIYEENGGKFPAGAGETVRPTEKAEWFPMTPENVARMNELLAIDAAKTELRRVAMILHAEARGVLQNVFLCPEDVALAVENLKIAHTAIITVLRLQTVITALNLPNK